MGDVDSTLFYAITGAYMLYVLLCGLAIWSTFQNSSSSSRTLMRVLLVAMLLVLTANFSILAIQRHSPSFAAYELFELYSSYLKDDILKIASNVATCLAGVLSDGLLAWRCFVLFGKRPWMKWLLTALVALDFGSLSNIALSTMLRFNQDILDGPIQNAIEARDSAILAQKLVDVWAWLFFALNTSMTMSIIYKILQVGCFVFGPCKDHYIYNTVIRAIIESSLIVWMGLLTYTITETWTLSLLALGTDTTTELNVQMTSDYTFMFLSFIFGISQTLIIARIGFSRLRSPSKAAKRTATILASNYQVDEKAHIDLVLDITKGGNDIEMCTTRSTVALRPRARHGSRSSPRAEQHQRDVTLADEEMSQTSIPA